MAHIISLHNQVSCHILLHFSSIYLWFLVHKHTNLKSNAEISWLRTFSTKNCFYHENLLTLLAVCFSSSSKLSFMVNSSLSLCFVSWGWPFNVILFVVVTLHGSEVHFCWAFSTSGISELLFSAVSFGVLISLASEATYVPFRTQAAETGCVCCNCHCSR